MHFCVQPEPSHASAQPTSCISARSLPPLTFARNLLPAFLRAGCPAHGARSLPPEFLRAACPRTFARSLPPAFLRASCPSHRNFIYLLTYELFVFARKSNKSKKLE